MSKSTVAALLTRPESVLQDIERLCELAGVRQALDPSRSTILKDNISWHFPLPGANTTPWQLEGAILALEHAGYRDLSCVQNETVVTDAFKGEDLNHYRPVFEKHGVRVLYNFEPKDMSLAAQYPLGCSVPILRPACRLILNAIGYRCGSVEHPSCHGTRALHDSGA